jgi:hypothetical protein
MGQVPIDGIDLGANLNEPLIYRMHPNKPAGGREC